MNLGRLEYWIYTSDDFIVKKVLSKIPPPPPLCFTSWFVSLQWRECVYGAKTIRLFKDCKHWFMEREKLHEFLPHWPTGISDGTLAFSLTICGRKDLLWWWELRSSSDIECELPWISVSNTDNLLLIPSPIIALHFSFPCSELSTIFYRTMIVELQRKIQHCERSELRSHLEWTKT